MKLIDLPNGSLFSYKGSIALKSEYRTDNGAVECYLLGSGEMFWGGTNNANDLNNLEVDGYSLAPQSNGVAVKIAEKLASKPKDNEQELKEKLFKANVARVESEAEHIEEKQNIETNREHLRALFIYAQDTIKLLQEENDRLKQLYESSSL
jgi:phosphoribosylaminoimidazole carboxylase (NCAIR synthetase)